MSDPAAGKFEMPGGHCEGSEAPRAAATREWQEETGLRFPDGEWTGTWTSPDGIYQGFVYTIAREADLDIFDRQLGSDPDGDVDGTETIAWWDPADLPGNPAVRAELLADIDAVMAALGCPPDCCGAECCTGGCCGGEAGCQCGPSGGDKEAVVKAYPDGQSYGSHAFRPTGPFEGFPDGMPNVCHYCGVERRDPFHDNWPDEVAKAGGAAPKVPERERPGPEPIWGEIEDRRASLTRKHLKAVLAAWNALTADLDPRALVRQYRAGAGQVAKYADPDRNKALEAALAWLAALYARKGWAALVAAIEDAIRSGMAEGEAGALAVAAARQGVTGFAIDQAFAAAYERLASDGSISQQAADTAESMVSGAAGDVSGVLAGTPDDASEDDTADAVDSTVTGNDVRSVNSWLQDAIWSAFGAGALALYAQASQEAGAAASGDPAGVAVLVDWLNEPGACVICQENAANGPYAPQDVPPYLAHRNCRCWLASSSGLPASILASFLS